MILAALPLLLLCAGVIAAYLNLNRASRTGWVVAFGAFAIRVAYVAVDSVLGIFAGYGDASGYDATFRFVAGLWQSGVVLAPLRVGASPGNDGQYMILYSTLFAPVYTLLGSSPVLPRLLMAMFGALVVVNVYLLAGELAGRRAALYAGGLAAVFPYWVVYSGVIYRDMLIVFFLSAMALFLVRWQTGGSRRALALAVLFAALGVFMREQNVLPVAAMAATVVFAATDRSRREYAAAFVGATVVGVVVVAVFDGLLPIDALAGQRLWLARPNAAAYFTGLAYETGVELLVYAPVGALYFALTPFPWQAVNLLAVISIAQNLLLWYPVVILAVLGARDLSGASGETPAVVSLLVFALVGIFGYGLVEGNLGPAMRHRMQFQFVFFAFAGVGLANRVRMLGLKKWAYRPQFSRAEDSGD
jgi:hypothetical protein